MEARDSGSRIRPLPVDDLDGDAPQQSPIEPSRRLGPLIVIVLGALAFAFIARGLGVGCSTDVAGATTVPPASLAEEADETTTTTTTTTPPPKTLLELLPAADAGLNLVVAGTTAAQLGVWESDQPEPAFSANVSQYRYAQYNSDGSAVAVFSGVRDGSFVVGPATGIGPATIRGGITSGLWHPEDPDLFAWITHRDETTSLNVADLSGTTGAGVQPLVELSLGELAHELRAWGDWGFATQLGNDVHGFDADGILTRSATDARFYDAAADGSLLLGTTDEDGAVPYLLHPDGSQTALPSLDIGADDFRISADGQWVFAVTIQQDGHTSLLARTVYSRSTRLTSVDDTADIVGLTSDDRFVVLQAIDSYDLVFKNWNTGAEFRLQIGLPVAAVSLPAEPTLQR